MLKIAITAEFAKWRTFDILVFDELVLWFSNSWLRCAHRCIAKFVHDHGYPVAVSFSENVSATYELVV